MDDLGVPLFQETFISVLSASSDLVQHPHRGRGCSLPHKNRWLKKQRMEASGGERLIPSHSQTQSATEDIWWLLWLILKKNPAHFTSTKPPPWLSHFQWTWFKDYPIEAPKPPQQHTSKSHGLICGQALQWFNLVQFGSMVALNLDSRHALGENLGGFKWWNQLLQLLPGREVAIQQEVEAKELEATRWMSWPRHQVHQVHGSKETLWIGFLKKHFQGANTFKLLQNCNSRLPFSLLFASCSAYSVFSRL